MIDRQIQLQAELQASTNRLRGIRVNGREAVGAALGSMKAKKNLSRGAFGTMRTMPKEVPHDDQ